MGILFSDPIDDLNAKKKTLIYYSDEEQYLGEVKDGLRQGYGVYSYTNGDRYEGGWAKNLKHGFGYFYYNNGELYMGNWAENKKNGKGMYFYQTGDRFDGDWNMNMKHGQGTFHYSDGRIFEGSFKNSKKHGTGRLQLVDGSVYEEKWEEGERLESYLIKPPVIEEEEEEYTKSKIESRRQKNRRAASRKSKKTKFNLRFDASKTIKATQYINQDLIKKNIKEWSDEEIGIWLDRGGFSKYQDNFRNNHIDGNNLFDLTEEDLSKELGIEHQDIKNLMKDIELLKEIYPPNETQSKYVRQKLLKFYQKNKDSILDITNGVAEIPKKKDLKKDNIKELANEGIKDLITNASANLRDANDAQDTLNNTSGGDSSSSTSSDSDDSEEEKDQLSPLKKNTSKSKFKKDDKPKIPSQIIEKEEEEDASESITALPPIQKKATADAQIPKKPNIFMEGGEENSFQMSEYHTTIDKFQKNDFDLNKTIKQMLGSKCFIEYSELEIGKKLGEGGYGEVHVGTWLGQDVAIKFYGRKKIKKKDKKIDADFLKEVEVLNNLRHPNIVLFMGVSITPQYKGLLVTELLEGGSLFDHLHKKGTKFTDDEIVEIALDMSLGMKYLHGKALLHCDLKSPNILLDENRAVKLADFGLSSSKARFQKRKKFKRIGTPHWMAPEIMREEGYDEASDVYSYGMILWEMIARKIPYWGMKVTQIVGSVGYGDKQVEIPEKGNKVILELMKRCLSKDRKARPSFEDITEYLKSSEKQKKYIAMKELNAFFNEE